MPPLLGDAFLYAPQGIIDAGEAGIAARNVVLAAQQVVNTQNISFSQGAVGVPDASAAAASVGALTGAGSVTETSNLTEQTAGLNKAAERMNETNTGESLTPKWLRVEFVGFEE